MKRLVPSSSKQSLSPWSDGVILRSFESSGETKFEALILDLLHESAVRLNSPRHFQGLPQPGSDASSVFEVSRHFFLCFGLVKP